MEIGSSLDRSSTNEKAYLSINIQSVKLFMWLIGLATERKFWKSRTWFSKTRPVISENAWLSKELNDRRTR